MADDAFSLRSSLSITTDDDDEDLETVPLRTRILNVVKSCPNYTIRPARLSQELGMSMSDATTELCGLLQICKHGSSFHFETVENVQTIVFVFPPDIEQQARAQQRKEDFGAVLKNMGTVAIRVLKILTAFGLIISTIIVSVAGMIALVAALIALSRGGGGDSRNTRNHVSRQLQNLFLTIRQLLWCYAMFGPTGEGQDPFLREAAYDTSLVLGLCCGNPWSVWYWIRASHLRQRRHRFGQGWGRSNSNVHDMVSDLEGVSLIRRNQWGQEETLPVPAADELHRGLLSVAVEFLFGPGTPPSPTEADKWKLRSAVIVQKSSKNSGAISLQDLVPYSDSPPASLDDRTKIVSEGLLVVSYFHGTPSKSAPKLDDPSKALFSFPELVAENPIAMRLDSMYTNVSESENIIFDGFFYLKDATTNQSPRSGNLPELPSHLREEYKAFTKLTSKQFFHCLLVAILNFIGVLWFAQSLDPGGILYESLGKLGGALRWGLIPILQFYAKLFFVIPSVRLLYLFAWNELCKRRNQKREYLASMLTT